MENKLKVGIAHGDINGISYEMLIKVMEENRLSEVCIPIIYGSSKVVGYHRKTLNLENIGFNSIQTPENANPKRCNIINCVDDEVKVELGQETEDSNKAAITALKKALDDLDKGLLDVVVLAPQNATAFKLENVKTGVDFFGRRYRSRNTLPVFVGEDLKVSMVTGHIPLKDIDSELTQDAVFYKTRQLINTLQNDFTIEKPIVGLLGLNPAGVKDEHPDEESEVILPAIARLRERDMMVVGPFTAERLFSGIEYKKFDAVVAMYYDQARIPFGTLTGNAGALLIAGLPVVITSTACGVGYDIVGKGQADEAGLRNAIYLAIDVFNNRQRNKEIAANPLKHYEVSGNANESDMNVDQIAGVETQQEEL